MVKKINEELMSDVVNALGNDRMTGYQIFNAIKDRYQFLSKRLVYHYLKVALLRGMVEVESVEEAGKYSWGRFTSKKYYRKLAESPRF